MELRQAIESVCQTLAYFGITLLNPELLRQASLASANPIVSDHLWQALFKLIVLHLNAFQAKLNPEEENPDLVTVQTLVTYVLYKWQCPVNLTSSKELLFALGFVISKVDFFQHFDAQTKTSHHLLFTPELLNAGLQEHIANNDKPEFQTASYLSILSLYNTIQKHIHFAMERAKHCFKMIQLVREHCGQDVEPEDLLVTQTEEQVRAYETSQEMYLRGLERHQAEVEGRKMFWEWLVTLTYRET